MENKTSRKALAFVLTLVVGVLLGLLKGTVKDSLSEKHSPVYVSSSEDSAAAKRILLKVGRSAATSVVLEADYPEKNGHAYVDLALPSGTKWATCNIGATSPDKPGKFFAWGESKPKSTFRWSNLKCWVSGDESTGVRFSKYVTDSANGAVDNKTELDLEDDAAHINWGGTWRVPSKEQMEELMSSENCEWEWMDFKDVNGYCVRSTRNGKCMFLPAAGYREGSVLCKDGVFGRYWSRSLHMDDVNGAYYLSFDPHGVDGKSNLRYFGRSVRPVFN